MSCHRVGREDASSRQDIVLSGHFIQDEHCIFTSATGPNGEGESSSDPSMFPSTLACVRLV